MKSDRYQPLKSESGQSVILIATVILSFLLFFGFAVNTGLLITAKISLQSAADAAAYAGAATQARQLNAISFLNYDMRRQYKKFLYRYVYVASLGTPGFPNPNHVQNNGNYGFPKRDFVGASSTGGRPQERQMKVPVLCVPITGKTNQQSDNCMTLNLPDTAHDIETAFPGGTSGVWQETIKQITSIQNVQNSLCKGQGEINSAVLMAWLFRGDNDNATLNGLFDSVLKVSDVPADDQKKVIQSTQGLLQGLGLFPRNILNLMRILTLEKFLNMAAQKDVTLEKAGSWENSRTEADQYERPIQAIKSAWANLNDKVLAPENLILQELQNSDQLKLDVVSHSFNVFVQKMIPTSATGTGTTGTTGYICDSTIIPFPVFGAPIGVKRIGGFVHYAVKVTAKARLLFLPLKDGIELEAVAGAKPFGSRVGPTQDDIIAFDQMLETTSPPTLKGAPVCDLSKDPLKCQTPNLKLTATSSFYSFEFLKSLAILGQATSGTFNMAGLAKSQKHATAPNPVEVGRYNILPPPQAPNKMYFEFIPYATSATSTIYRFYAPLKLGNEGDLTDFADKFIDNMFQRTQVGTNNFGLNMAILGTQIKTTMGTYLKNKLTSGSASENNETETFAAIELPMPIDLEANPKFWLTEPGQVLSSWGPQHSRVNAGPPSFKARFGYSVKFVALRNLIQEGMLTTDDDLGKVSH